jgi:hypothetical protein
MKKLILAILTIALASAASAQNTTVSGTVTDSDSIAWASGNITFNLVGASGTVFCNGVKMTLSQLSVTGALDTTGSFSALVCRNSSITPISSQWAVTVCSAATAPCQNLGPVTISGTTQDLTSFISSTIKAIRISIAPNTRAYSDVEIVSPPLGATYFSLITLTNRTWNGTSWGPVGSFSATPLFAFQGYGDSYVSGAGSVAGVSVGSGFAQLARTIPSVPPTNNGVSGTTSDSINLSIWKQIQPSPQQASAYLFDGGANDGLCGTSNGCLVNFQEEINSSIALMEIPNQERVMGSACTQTAGTWAADTAVYTVPAPTFYLAPGNPVSTSSNGSVLTCTIPSRSTSTEVGVNFLVTNAQTGTFTVTVDGVIQKDQCSGTTTFTSAPCVANLMTLTTTMFRQGFTGTPGLTHTLVITTTNANKVSFALGDAVTTIPQPNSNYVNSFGPQAHFTNEVQYNAAFITVVNKFISDGARVAYSDLTSTTNPGPGVNNTTDVSMTSTVNCDNSLTSFHPNDVCGYYHLAQTIVNASHLRGWNIFGNIQPFNASGNLPLIAASPIAASLQANVDSATIPGATIGTGASAFNFMGISGLRSVYGFSITRNNTFIGSPLNRGIDFLCGPASGMAGPCGGFTQEGLPWTQLGAPIASATTIAPTGTGVFHVTGTTPIVTITSTATCVVYHGITQICELDLIPDGAWSTTTAGNIAVATNAIAGKLLIMRYDPVTLKWYPSY